MVKTCTKCKEEKPLEFFSKKTSARDGLMSDCKACDAARCKAYRDANKEKKAASDRAWNEANKEKAAANKKAYWEANKEKAAASTKAWKDANPHKCLATTAKYRARKYNALPSWYSQKHHNQIIGIYEERDRITQATGVMHEVDHILPINGDTVSGFHIPGNLQIIPRTENRSKGNKYDFS